MCIHSHLKSLRLTPTSSVDFAPLCERQVGEVEELMGARLPSDYRSFLTTYGESDFDGWVSFTNGEFSVSIGHFYGPDLLAEIRGAVDWLPDKMVPIAEDGGGNSVCISLGTNDFGRIFFRYHGEGWSGEIADVDQAKRSVLLPLAESFEAFALRLTLEE